MALVLVAPLWCLGCAGETVAPDGGEVIDAGVFDRHAVVVLPDTQFYACAYPQIFQAQTEWIADSRAELGIALAVHTGDIVDADVAEQWQVASQNIHGLDGLVPYLLTAGNHDLRDTARNSLIDDYFDPDGMRWKNWSFSTMERTRVDNSFAVVELSGRDWLFVGLEFAPRDAAVEWAGEVLEQHADLPAVLFTHAYLYSDGARYDRAATPPQPYHPDGYGVTPEQGINDGEDLWRRLVEPHENVKLVLSGHVIPDGTARSTALRSSGSRVHQVLANYQRCDLCPCEQVEGGAGYLRLLDFAPDAESITVKTYSPYRDDSLSDPENEFELLL